LSSRNCDMRRDCQLLYDNELAMRSKYPVIAGVDEAGRGPIAGPVVVAAVILDPANPVAGVNDSKQLSEHKRELLFDVILSSALAYSIIEISPRVIDEINILQAVLSGMVKALDALSVSPDVCLIDGNRLPKKLKYHSLACVKGDANYASIAAASILAKVHRDRLMITQDMVYPQYGFAKHKGYPTALHLQALHTHGPCPIHRLSYGPVQQLEIWQR